MLSPDDDVGHISWPEGRVKSLLVSGLRAGSQKTVKERLGLFRWPP
jgi:hypothetical protein